MTTAGTNITKANIVQSFKDMRDTYNTGIVWHATNSPFTPAQPNTYNGVVNETINPAGGPSAGYPFASGTGLIENNIPDSVVTASTIVTEFRNMSAALSRIRKARLIKYYSTTFPADARAESRVDFDQTNVTSMDAKYATSMDSVGVANVSSGQLISGSNINQFVTNLSTAINNARNNTLTFKEYYCHSSCHSSCHGSI
jgi:hypothetical protein